MPSLTTRSYGSRCHLSVAVALAVFTTASYYYYYSHRPTKITDKDTLVLGDFTNATGDPVFDGTLRQGLAVQLEQSPFLNFLSEEGIHNTLQMMGQPLNARLTPQISREICQRTTSAATLEGSIAQIGTQYDLILRAINCVTGELLASTETQASDKSHVLDALGKVASEMRRKLGESLTTMQKCNTPLAQATTPSLEALQAFTLGVKAANDTAALPFFRRATQLDPNFAGAYSAMSGAYANIGETTLAAENVRKAFDLRAGVSEREKLEIEENYYGITTGELIKERSTDELGVQTYPREPFFHTELAFCSNALGQYEAGLKEILQTQRLFPYPSSFIYRQLVHTYLMLERVEDAAAAAREAHAKGSDSNLEAVLYEIAFHHGDTAEMARQVANSSGKPADENLLLALEADTAAYFGHLGKAREFSRRAADSADVAGEKETAASYSAVSALREALFGDAAKGRQLAAISVRRSTERDVDYGVALALAYAGDASRAQALADDLAKRFPEDTIVQFNYLPTLRAKLALHRSDPQQALDALEVAAPYELGLPSSSFYNWLNLYPLYVRGEAYLVAHRGSEAIAEFQKILGHRGVVFNEPIGALAHLQLGRAYAIKGDTSKARVAYQDFLTLWKDADLDIPILRQAKAEYSKLK